MARQITIDTDHIVRAARDVFLKHGITAKTSDVAKRARVSEGSIFVRFKTKQDLFVAAMQAEAAEDWLEELVGTAADARALEHVLLDIGRAGITYFRKVLPLAMMVWSNPPRGPAGKRAPKTDRPPQRDRRLLADFLARQAAHGRIRPLDTEAAARGFLASCTHYVLEEQLRLRKRHTPAEDERYLAGVVELFWNGIRP